MWTVAMRQIGAGVMHTQQIVIDKPFKAAGRRQNERNSLVQTQDSTGHSEDKETWSSSWRHGDVCLQDTLHKMNIHCRFSSIIRFEL